MPRDRDLKYAAMFWEKGQPKGMLEAMSKNIQSASLEGKIHMFVNPKGISENEKMKMSAYRLLADAIGYEIGAYNFNKDGSHTATAPINKRYIK